MQNLNEFSSLRDKIINCYEGLKSSGLIPVKTFDAVIDDRSIDGAIENLRAGKFIVSVCGQIKAGKSMLLNDIIFSDETLPTADTPETAKITEISYGEKPEYIVYFYSPQEWEQLKNSPVTENGVTDTYFNLAIRPAFEEVRKITGKDINEAEALARQTIRGTNLADLNKFISVKGVFTTLVKSIQIKYPADILKNITIVDTPGINDPNVFRSQITEKWINQSDAVIFLLSAAQPFTMQDKEFFERYLLPVPVSKIIMVVSKADLADDISQIKNFVTRSLCKVLGKTGEALVENREICLIAPMFSLFRKLREKNDAGTITVSKERLSEIDYQFNDRAKTSAQLRDISEKNGYMENFTAALEKNLISVSGSAIMDSHVKKIASVFEYHIKNHETENVRISAEISAANAAEKALVEELSALREEKEKFSIIKDGIDGEFDKISGFFHQNVEEVAAKGFNEINKKIETEKVQALAANLSFDVYSFVENSFNDLNRRFAAMIENFKSKIITFSSRLGQGENEMGVLIKNVTGQIFNEIDVTKVMSDVKFAVNKGLAAAELKPLMAKWLFFWPDDKKTKDNFSERLEKVLVTDETVKSVIINAGSGAVNGVKTKLGQLFYRLETRAEALKKEESVKAAALKSKAEEIKKLSMELETGVKAIKALAANLDKTIGELK